MAVGTTMMLEARTRSDGGKRPVQHRHPDRHHQSAAGSLHDPEQHELSEALGRPAQGRRAGEDHDGDQQHPPAAEAVAQPARGRYEHGQADQVGDRRRCRPSRVAR